MGDVRQCIRLHGQTRMRMVGISLLALVFVLVLRFAIATSVAPDSMGLILSTFTLVLAGVCACGVVRGVWHLFAPRIEMTLSPYPLVIGQRARIEWEFQSHRGRVRDLRIEARFLGARYDRTGDRVDTPDRIPLVKIEGDLAAAGSREVELPRDLVSTSPQRNRETGGRWSIEVRARVEGAPGVFEDYPVRLVRR